MKIHLLGEPEIIMSNPEGKFSYFAWPTITKLQNGKIAVAASGFRLDHVCPFGKAVIAYSGDGGKTYTQPAPVIDTVLDDRDAGLCPFGDKGLILTSFNNTVEFQRNYNKASDKTEKEKALIAAYLDTVTGKAEAEALGAEFKISLDCGVTFGKRYESPVTSPHGPVELQDGTVLWVGTTFRKNEALGEDRIEAYTVHPDGSMEKIGQIPQVYENGKPLQFCEPHTVQLSDQTLICHIRVEPTFTTYQSKSTDGGRTWSLPRRILEDMGGAPVHLLEHSSGMLLGLYSYRKHPYGIRAMFSSDGGETWETGYTIYRNEISGDLGYPSTIEMEDGSLLTVFYAHPGETAPAVILQQRWTF